MAAGGQVVTERLCAYAAVVEVAPSGSKGGSTPQGRCRGASWPSRGPSRAVGAMKAGGEEEVPVPVPPPPDVAKAGVVQMPGCVSQEMVNREEF